MPTKEYDMTVTARRSVPAVAPAAPPPRGRRRRRAVDTAAGNRTLLPAADPNRPRVRVLYWVTLTGVFLLFLLVFLFPLYWMVTGALKSPVELAQPTPTLYPHGVHPETYAQAWTELQIARYALNTALYAIGGW